jgi:hypothetical protein
MVQCTVIRPFYDLAEGVDRKIGGAFSCTSERAEYLKKLGLVQVAPEKKAAAPSASKPPVKRKAPAKKTTKRG